ncbi:MAG: LLM class flavin-dependent oxidoreductase [Actinomycetota bacterium]
MRVGFVLMPSDPWPTTVATARHLDEAGADHLWVYDHLSWRHYRDLPWHATYPWLTGVAAVTERIRLGTMVSNLNVRHPVTLAKDAMTIDHISGGRLMIGVGAAGLGFDATVLGQAELSPGQRMDRLVEATGVIDGLLRGSLTDHTGDWYTVDGARMLPGCVQRPRLRLGVAASGPRGLGLAADVADAWITIGDPTDPDRSVAAADRALARQCEILDEACEAVGRDPASIDRILLTGHTDERPLGSVDAFDDCVGRHAELGFTDLVFHHPRDDDPVWNEPPEIVGAVLEHHRPS